MNRSNDFLLDIVAFNQAFTFVLAPTFSPLDTFVVRIIDANETSERVMNASTCLYGGYVQQYGPSFYASISLCEDDRTSWWLTEDDVYNLAPLDSPNEVTTYIVYRKSDFLDNIEINTIDGCKPIKLPSHASLPNYSNSLTYSRDETSSVNLRIWLVADQSMVEQYGKEDVVQRIQSIYAGAKSIILNGNQEEPPFIPNISPQLVGVTVWTSNPIEPSVNGVVYLSRFCHFQSNHTFEYDAVHLLTFINVIATAYDIVGLAYVGTACTDAGCGITQDMNPNSISSSSEVLAHEIGHNLGSLHDGENNNCTQIYVMSAELEDRGITWSPCSVGMVNTFVNTQFLSQSFCNTPLLSSLDSSVNQFEPSLLFAAFLFIALFLHLLM